MYMYGDIHDHLQRNDVPGKCKYLRKHVCLLLFSCLLKVNTKCC